MVFGCGGDRDRGKRPIMGKIAGTLADLAVVTSDNPRTEDPEAIIAEVMAGVPQGSPHLRVADRREAIRQTLAEAHSGDTVLLAGKGHETYQVIGKEYLPFDEKEIVAELLGDGRGGMMRWTDRTVRAALGLAGPASDAVYSGISTDTRAIGPNALFVALKGERFDAHDFLAGAKAAGATGAVVRRGTAAGTGPDALSGGRHRPRPGRTGPRAPQDHHRSGHRHHRYQRQDLDQGNGGPRTSDAISHLGHPHQSQQSDRRPAHDSRGPGRYRGAGRRGGRQPCREKWPAIAR